MRSSQAGRLQSLALHLFTNNVYEYKYAADVYLLVLKL